MGNTTSKSRTVSPCIINCKDLELFKSSLACSVSPSSDNKAFSFCVHLNHPLCTPYTLWKHNVLKFTFSKIQKIDVCSLPALEFTMTPQSLLKASVLFNAVVESWLNSSSNIGLCGWLRRRSTEEAWPPFNMSSVELSRRKELQSLMSFWCAQIDWSCCQSVQTPETKASPHWHRHTKIKHTVDIQNFPNTAFTTFAFLYILYCT